MYDDYKIRKKKQRAKTKRALRRPSNPGRNAPSEIDRIAVKNPGADLTAGGDDGRNFVLKT